MCDFVCTDYLGADRLTNNTGELSGLTMALLWARSLPPGLPLKIQYDSEYAAKTTQRIWRAHANFRLILRARWAFDAVRAQRIITWTKVESHTGDFLNSRADLLAKFGAEQNYIRESSAGIREWLHS